MSNASKSTFRVVLLPDPARGTTREDALTGLAARFRIDREKAGTYLDRAPCAIKQGLNRRQAHQYQQAIIACGLDCRIEPESEQISRERSDPSLTEFSDESGLPCCPNCGYRALNQKDPLITAFDGMGQCPSCGIIVAKFLERGQGDKSIETCQVIVPDEHSESSSGPRQFPGVPIFRSGLSLRGRLGKPAGLVAVCLFVVVAGSLFFRDGGFFDQKSGTKLVGSPLSNSRFVAFKEAGQAWVEYSAMISSGTGEVDPSWFDASAIRISSGENWQGSLSFKLPYESAYLEIFPTYSGEDSFEPYEDLELHVETNNWQDQQVQISIIEQHVYSYQFPIWVFTDGNRVTHLLSALDRSISMEQLGQIPQEQLGTAEWRQGLGNLPRNFDPVFDLSQGQGRGYKVDVILSIHVPDEFADYSLLTHLHDVHNRAEIIYLKDRVKQGPRLAITLAKKKGDTALYLKPGGPIP